MKFDDHHHRRLCRHFFHLLFLSLSFSFPSASPDPDIAGLFDSWCRHHAKSYSSEQDRLHRLLVFQDNYHFVARHNAAANSSYSLALNAFADLTHHEFRSSYLGLAGNSDLRRRRVRDSQGHGLNGDVPASVDWRKEGAVTAVKDQGSCGACWSFSTTGAIEGINKLVTGSLVSLSEQELVDCDRTFDAGCGGGLMDYAYQFVIDNGGIDMEEDYPYVAREKTCNKEKYCS